MRQPVLNLREHSLLDVGVNRNFTIFWVPTQDVWYKTSKEVFKYSKKLLSIYSVLLYCHLKKIIFALYSSVTKFTIFFKVKKLFFFILAGKAK